ncbi:MAG: HD domain-containing protein [candidate division WOR-3 bacterium]
MKSIIDRNLPQKEILHFLKSFKNENYFFVGGFVRDFLLGKKDFEDFDVLVITENFEKELSNLKVKPIIVNDRFNTLRFFIEGKQIDITFAKSLTDDLKRRDFTINSIAMDNKGNIIDPHGYKKDLRKKIIRLSNENSFKDDPLRILRAFRFRYELNFKFSKGLRNFILESKYLLKNVAKERISFELKKILSYENGETIFKDLKDYGILEIIFPEVDKTKNFVHKKFKSRYLLNHLINTVFAAKKISKQNVPEEWKVYFKKYYYEVYLASFFHDIKKPESFKILNKRQTFFNHDLLSSIYVEKVLKESLKLSNEETKRIQKLVKNHMRPHYLLNSKNLTEKGLYKILKDNGDDLEGLFLVSMADQLSSEGIFDERYIKLYQDIKLFEKKLKDKKINFISGKDILEKFKIKPGPLVGKMIKEGNYFAIKNSITDKEKILAYLEQKFGKFQKS